MEESNYENALVRKWSLGDKINKILMSKIDTGD